MQSENITSRHWNSDYSLPVSMISVELDNDEWKSQKCLIFWDHVTGLVRCETEVTKKQEPFWAKHAHTHTHTHTHTQTWVGICGLILHPLRKY